MSTKQARDLQRFLAHISAQLTAYEQQSSRKTTRTSQGFWTYVCESLRKVRRKEFQVEIRLQPDGTQEPFLRQTNDYFLCPVCLRPCVNVHWIDADDGLTGPWCDGCCEAELRRAVHEDGMAYDDARVYRLPVSESLFAAVSLYRKATPAERSVPADMPPNEELAEDELVF